MKEETNKSVESITGSLTFAPLVDSLTIQLSNGPIVIIKPTGEVWVNPKYTTTEAAQAFWDAFIQTNPLIGRNQI